MNLPKVKTFPLIVIMTGMLLNVFAGDNNLKPQIKVNKKAGFLPLLVSFSCNEDASDEIFYWDFGNGNTSLSRYATNVYANPGNYKVKLVVRSGSEMAVDSVNIEVLPNDELINNMSKLRASMQNK